MKKKIVLILVTVCFFSSIIIAYASTNKFNYSINDISLNINDKNNSIMNNFNDKYSLNISTSSENSDLEEEIKLLTKKTTYLLFGPFNNQNESSKDFYNRYKEWLNLRYNPEIPKGDSINGFDVNSQEYKDDLVSGMAIAQIFNQVEERGFIYNSYGDIRVSIGDEIIESTIVIPNMKMKSENKEDPMKYDYIKTNFIMHYFYKNLNGTWKLYYLYGEDATDIDEYFNALENTESKVMSIAPSYESNISKIYSFDKLNAVTDSEISSIFNKNASNIVFLNGYYNNMVVASANGFFIGDGLILTTWKFLEKSLLNAQYITIKNLEKSMNIEGIVTVNPEVDIAIIKVKERNKSVDLGDSKDLNLEDPVVIISSKSGTGLVTQKGIVTYNKDYLKTSIPLTDTDEGSPLLNIKGEVIGINTSKLTNSSMSIANNSNGLIELKSKFKDINYDDIDAISFEKLKENYYYIKYDKEQVINNIPKSKWKKYSKIGSIDEKIKLELLKANYKNGIVSLRYKNNISKYISSMQLALSFKEQLKTDGFKEVFNSSNKAIYESNKYQIIIMDEHEYLIIVMVKL